MSDKPTPKPNTEKSAEQMKAKHEQPGYGGKVKQTSPGIMKMEMPAKGKECAYEKSHTKQEARFNKRGAVTNWNKKRPHKRPNLAAHRNPAVPDPSTPQKVKPPECKQKYDGKKIW